VLPAVETNSFRKAAFVLLCVYLISNLANDFSARFFGSRAYLSVIAGALLPLCCLASRFAFAGLNYPIGRWWAAFIVWMVLCIPTSFWPGGSTDATREFFTKNYVLFFYVVAAVVSLSQLQILFRVMATSGFLVILACYFYGGYLDGRLLIPNSIFFDNSNDLGLQLLISAGFFLYMLNSRNILAKFAGAGLMGASLLYLLRTGSRSTFVAVIVCIIALFMLTKKKALLMAAVALMAVIAAFAVSSNQLSRLVYIVFDPEDQVSEENGALMSQVARTELLKRSIGLTFQHPVLGVGPGMFSEVIWAEGLKKGDRIDLKTHNAYTQVSSEMGFPGLIFYVMTEFGALLLAFRIFKRADKNLGSNPQCEIIRNLALSLFLMLVGYSVSSIFNHVAYSRHLPTLAGMTIALAVLAQREMKDVILLPFRVPWSRSHFDARVNR